MYYHGSPISNIKVLEPRLSNHGSKFVYLTTNEVVATFYMVSNNFYTYGFEKDWKVPVYTEYYPNALADIYSGKKGFLYECVTDKQVHNPTNIGCAFVCEETVDVYSETVIDDVYVKLMKFIDEGKLILNRYEELSEAQIKSIDQQIELEIIEEKLLESSGEYARFIKDKFSRIWNKVFEAYVEEKLDVYLE